MLLIFFTLICQIYEGFSWSLAGKILCLVCVCMWCVRVGAYMHVCMLSVYVCGGGWVHSCSCMQRQEEEVECPVRSLFTHSLETESITEPRASQKPASPRNPPVSVSQKMLWLQEGTAIPCMSPGDLNSVPYACSANSQCYPPIYLPSPLSSMWLVSTCHSGRSAPWQLKYIS